VVIFEISTLGLLRYNIFYFLTTVLARYLSFGQEGSYPEILSTSAAVFSRQKDGVPVSTLEIGCHLK
jgi:hypothetical protein